MRRSRGLGWVNGWALVAGVVLAPTFALAETAVGVTADDQLVTFDTSAPTTLLRRVAITGLQAGAHVVGVDFRPADGRLYGLGSSSRLYVIDRATGAATQVGAGPFTPALSGADFAVDFNPIADRLRVISDTDQNLRLDPTTGQVVDADAVTPGTQPDTPVAYAIGDVNLLANPNFVAAAYDQNVAGGTTTTLFGIDSNLDVVVRVGDVNGTPTGPNGGALHTIGALNVNASELTSFDISGTTAYAAITVPAGTLTELFTVDLSTGTATVVGAIGGGSTIRAFAIAPVRFFAVTSDNELITLGSGAPGVTTPAVAITGLQTGEHIVSTSVRPSTGQLYGLGTTGRLYRISTTTGAATAINGPFAPGLIGTIFGIDFNPTVDRIRLVSNTGQNLRINPDTGQVVDSDSVTPGVQGDTTLVYAVGDPNFGVSPSVVAVAYDTNSATAAATTLFGIDTGLDVLVRIGSVNGTPNSPNGGELTTVGPLGFNAAGAVAFDIPVPGGQGFAVLTGPSATSSELYSINLLTGAATLIGTVGGGKVVFALSLAPNVPLAAPAAADLVALTGANELVKFNSATPGILSTPVIISGLQAGENVVAIDTRPSTGVLFGVTDQNRLYAINRDGGATFVGTAAFGPALAGANFGMDFNPSADRIRVVSDADQNLRIDPATGAVVDSDTIASGTQIDADLAFALGDAHFGTNPNVVGIAYDRNTIVAPLATTVYGVDAGLDVLVRLGSVDGTPNSPNSGQLTTIGSLGFDSTGLAGFEIIPNGAALIGSVVAGGTARLFQVDLGTGAATLAGDIGSGAPIRGLAFAPTADATPPVQPLTLKSLSIVLNFCGPRGKEALAMVGSLPAPVDPVTGKTVVVNIGGVTKTFVLDAKKRGVSGDDKFTLVGKAKNGLIGFGLSIKKEEMAPTLADEGLTGDTKLVKVERQVVVTVTFDGTTFQTTATVIYSAGERTRGTAKLRR